MSVYVDSPYMTPNVRMRAQSYIMNPNQNHIIEFDIQAQPSRARGLEIVASIMLNGSISTFDHRIWTPDQLADIYELAHHQLHGHDPRGLDPTAGPTRLEPFLHRG